MPEPIQDGVTPQGAPSDSKPPEAAKSEFQIPQAEWEKMMIAATKKSDERWAEKEKSLLATMEKEKEKARWEAIHPEVFEGENAKVWDATNAKPEYAALALDEKYKLSGIQPEKREVSTSVPSFSRGSPATTGETPKEVKDYYRSRGISDEMWEQLGNESVKK